MIKQAILHGSCRKSCHQQDLSLKGTSWLVSYLLAGNSYAYGHHILHQGLGEHFEVWHLNWKESTRLSTIKGWASLNTGVWWQVLQENRQNNPIEGSVKEEYDCALKQTILWVNKLITGFHIGEQQKRDIKAVAAFQRWRFEGERWRNCIV